MRGIQTSETRHDQPLREIPMDTPSLMLVRPPELADEDRQAEMLDFLYQLVNAFENQYRNRSCSVTINRPSYPNRICSKTSMMSCHPSEKQSLTNNITGRRPVPIHSYSFVDGSIK